MASFLPKSASVFLLTAFCFLSLIMLFQSSDCSEDSTGRAFIMKTTMGGTQQQHRKLLSIMKDNEMVFKNRLSAPATDGEERDMDDWELRAAPLGPDPLHHHGGTPKPRTTP